MCKTRLTTARPSWTGSVLLCALLTAACQQESAGVPDVLTSESGNTTVGLLTDDSTGNGGGTSGGTSSSLSGDILIAPEQPILRLRAEPGTLILDWSPMAGQTLARLYRHDSALPGEMLIHESDDWQQHLLHLPSATAQTPWHRQQYRLELCTADNCVSSERMALSGLAPATAQYLSPAVFLRGERFADQMALNHDASLAVISMPLEGSLEFHIRSETQWSLSQRLRLDDLPDFEERSFFLSASDTGDTVAVYIRNTGNSNSAEIRILERLGETWLQTTSLPLPGEPATDSAGQTAFGQGIDEFADRDHSITVSAVGNELLLHSEDRLYTSRRTQAGWSTPQVLADMNSTNTTSAPELRPGLISSTVSRDFTRILALVQQNGSTYLNLWSIEPATDDWQQTAHLLLSDFSQKHELSLHANTQGDQLLIAGWEAGNRAERYPIMWRYALNQNSGTQSAAEGISLQALSSLRAPPTKEAQATLVFHASEWLTQVVLGWQLEDDPETGNMPDAAFSTWQYHPQSAQWLSNLELPEAIPTLAKQDFGREMVLSADGSTLIMAVDARRTQANGSGIGEVLILR